MYTMYIQKVTAYILYEWMVSYIKKFFLCIANFYPNQFLFALAIKDLCVSTKHIQRATFSPFIFAR